MMFPAFRPRADRSGRAFALAAALAALTPAAFAANFNVASGTTDTTAKTLGAGAGQTGTVQANGTLAVSGSTVAVTISGNNATLTNDGTIKQTGTGRVIRDNTGVTNLIVNNDAGALMQSADADVIQMNKTPASVTLNNAGTMLSLNASKGGAQAVDFNAIQSGVNIINNAATGLLKAIDADAVRPGVNGVVNNHGSILALHTTDTGDDGVDLQQNTGATINNFADGSIEAARHGITGGAPDANTLFTATINNDGSIKGNNGSGINLDGFNAKQTSKVVNTGTITGNGVTGDGDGIDTDGVIDLTNSGTIKSLNSFAASGTETSEGVTVGGGTIRNTGTIEGDVAAGNLSAVGRGITIAGVDKDASDKPIPVQAPYAAADITNSGLIKGQSDSGIAFTSTFAGGFTNTINNQAGGKIEGAGATAATIQGGLDAENITNAGSIINDGGNSRIALALGGGDDHLTVTGGSAVITGGIDGGSGGEVSGDKLTFDLGAGHSFTHGGVISNFEKVEVLSGKVTLNGDNTYAGTTTVGGGSAAADLIVNGHHTGGGAYEVLSGNTLGGTGTLTLGSGSTAVTIDSGAAFHIGGGRFTMDSGAFVSGGEMDFDLNGLTAGAATGYDQLDFAAGNGGSLSILGGSQLHLNLGFTPGTGDSFTLVDLENASSNVSGTFAGLAEGAHFVSGGAHFAITYHGGDGNDVVVRDVPDSASTTSLLGLALAGVGLLATRRRAVR